MATLWLHYDYVMAAAPSTRLHVLDALMSCSDLPSGSKAIIAPTAGNVTSLALSQLKRDPQYPIPPAPLIPWQGP